MNPESGNLEVWTHSLDPMRATVRVRLPWPLEPAAEVRGRLMGPRCRFATTVEVAYPFRQMEPSVYAAVIPEPSLWEPGCPFLYEGPIECSLGGNVIQRAWVRHCLRTTKMGAHGFLLNGKAVRGAVRQAGRGHGSRASGAAPPGVQCAARRCKCGNCVSWRSAGLSGDGKIIALRNDTSMSLLGWHGGTP